ncbi:MAG: hypothetical protein AB8B64_18770 [Granulosicoccus sp.]
MDWHQEFKTASAQSALRAYFDRKFAWRFDDPDFAFTEVLDQLLNRILPKLNLTHTDKPAGFVYTCFGNATKDYGDKLYSRVPVPSKLKEKGKRYKRLFWDFCLNKCSINDLVAYCQIHEAEVRSLVAWLTREKKCPKPGVHGALSTANEPLDADLLGREENANGPFPDPDTEYQTSEQKRLLDLWLEIRPTTSNASRSKLEYRLRTLPRPRLSDTEKVVLRSCLYDRSIAETAMALGRPESQIKKIRSGAYKRIRHFCQEHDIDF